MIQLTPVTLRRGSKTLLEQANLLIHSGEKVGIVGKNGAGKSSLFALLRGELEAENGEVNIAKQIKLAQIRQDIPVGSQTIIDYVLAGDAELEKIKAEITLAEQAHDGMRLAELYQQYAECDGYTAESRAAKLLIGLGFKQEDLQSAIDDFSGGWRMRLNLAQLLMSPAELFLLDEPTNHLDLEAIIWLEQWLRDLPQTILIISHDREFLDHVVKRIVHVDAGQLKAYTGNYSSFEKQLAEQLTLQAKTFEKQQVKIVYYSNVNDKLYYKKC
jgi:ATP-binding cassette subfamily F protein 3